MTFPSELLLTTAIMIFRENIEPSLIALGCNYPFGWPIRKLSATLMRGEKKKVREFELRKINSRTLHYLWYTLDITDGTARVAQGMDHES